MKVTKIEIIKAQGFQDGSVRISVDDYQVYGFVFSNLAAALRRLEQVRERLDSLPVDIKGRAECELLVGRKVYWREFPAIISDFDGERGTVRLTADNEDKKFVVAPWEHDESPKHFSMVSEDLFSPKIHWFRDAPE